MHFLTKLLLLIALLLAAGCRQAVRSPLLPEAQTREVLRALAKTDKLDRLARAGDPGKVFDDLAREVTSEYARCQASLPQNNAARDEFGRIIDGYSLAGRLFAGAAAGGSLAAAGLAGAFAAGVAAACCGAGVAAEAACAGAAEEAGGAAASFGIGRGIGCSGGGSNFSTDAAPGFGS